MKARRFLTLLVLIFSTLIITAPLASAQEEEKKAGNAMSEKSLWQTLVLGGWVMIPLAGFSIAMLWLIIDGAQRSSLKRMMPEGDVEKARNFFRAGDYVGAYQSCVDNPHAFNNILRAGLINIGDGKEATEDGLLSETVREHTRQSTRLSYLSVIGVCTPMVGLLGTVVGMIKAFGELGQGGAGATQNTEGLSEAIGEVLVATASGLFIAIPAFMGFFFLRNRLQGAVHEVENEIGHLFRKFPYHLAEGVHVGDQELYANAPAWVEGAAGAEAAAQG
jgi:biopolymer transport protein ExbB